MSVRHEIAAFLSEEFADTDALADVDVLATERDIDSPTTPTVLIRNRTVRKAPAAPQSHREVLLWLTLISSHDDLDAAMDELDEILPALLDYLDTRFLHDDAEVVSFGSRLAYNIPTTILASKE